MSLRALLLACTLVLANAGAAGAAPPWGPPQTVADFGARTPALAFNSSGAGVATLGFGPGSTRIMSLAARDETPVTRSRDVASVEDGPLPYARTRTLSLRRRGGGTLTRLGYSYGRADGTVGTMRGLGGDVRLRPNEAELAVAPNGNAAIAYVSEHGGRTRVWLSTRRATSSRFTKPTVIRGTGSARSVAVSINDRGRYVVAYVYGAGRVRTVEARIGTLSRVGGLQKVGNQLGIARVDAVVARTGRATVAWTTHDGGEEQDEPTQLRTNVAPAGRGTFAGQVVLDRAAPGALGTEPTPPSLAAAPDGTTLVGYTLSGRFTDAGVGRPNFVTPARASIQDRSARFERPYELSADAVVGRVGVRSDGTFAVPYAAGVPLEGGPSPLYVALASARTRVFAPGELVAEDADQDAAVSFEPGAGGAPVVLYTRERQRGAAIARRTG